MARLSILCYPDERLHTVANPVEVFDSALAQHINDMFETMYQARGIGLASTQVNDHRRVIVMDLSEEKNQPCVFINPEIIQREGAVLYEEGCLSVPGIFEEVKRAERVLVKALDREGKPFELEAEGLLAICIQHEIDHLDGKVFVEYLSRLKQDRIKAKLKKQAKEGDKEPVTPKARALRQPRSI